MSTNWSSPTVPSATQQRPFGMDFLLHLLPPVHWNISNGRSKLNCTVVRLTVTDSWRPALMILPSERLLVRYQPYNIIQYINNIEHSVCYCCVGNHVVQKSRQTSPWPAGITVNGQQQFHFTEFSLCLRRWHSVQIITVQVAVGLSRCHPSRCPTDPSIAAADDTLLTMLLIVNYLLWLVTECLSVCLSVCLSQLAVFTVLCARTFHFHSFRSSFTNYEFLWCFCKIVIFFWTVDSTSGTRFTKHLRIILRSFYDNDRTYDNPRIILGQCRFMKYRKDKVTTKFTITTFMSYEHKQNMTHL